MTNTKRISGGFSLIELLTVIAIIAVLMGILFPVIASTRQRARRNACIANLAEIGTGLKMYRLDEGGYPPVLFRFVDEAKLPAQTAVTDGLFPNWVRRTDAFVCPNNPVLTRMPSRNATTLIIPNGATWTLSGAVTPTRLPAPEMRDGLWTVKDPADLRFPNGVRFAMGDSYDLAYVPTKKMSEGTGQWERHYSRQWTPMCDLSDPAQDPVTQFTWDSSLTTDAAKREAYARQLVFRLPDNSTLVTICTYHRDYPAAWAPGGPLPSGSKDVVLFADGHVESRSSGDMAHYGPMGWTGWQKAGK